MDFTSLIGPVLGGLFGAGGSSEGNKQSQTQTQTLDPRMANAVYGNLVPAATDWFKSNSSGLNPMMVQGLNQQYNVLQSPYTTYGYQQMMGNGSNLMAGPVAGNPFMGGGGLLGSQMYGSPAQSSAPSGSGGLFGAISSAGPFSYTAPPPVAAAPAAEPETPAYTGEWFGGQWMPVINGQRFIRGENFPIYAKSGKIIGYRITGEGNAGDGGLGADGGLGLGLGGGIGGLGLGGGGGGDGGGESA